MTFASFLDILPDPIHGIDASGAPGATKGPGFARVKLTSVEPSMKSSSAEYDLVSYHKWKVNLTYNPMTRDAFDPIYSFLMQKRNTLEPFYVELPQFASQTLTGIIVSSGGGLGDTTLSVSGTGISAGSMFLLREKGYLITRVETASEYSSSWPAPPAGNSRIHITPPLQEIVTWPDGLTFVNPYLKVVQVGDTVSSMLDTHNLYSFSLELEEAYAR